MAAALAIPPRIAQILRLESLLKRITYKPMTTIKCMSVTGFGLTESGAPSPANMVMVYVSVKMWSLDSTEREAHLIDITTPFSLDSYQLEGMTDQQIFKLVFEKVVELERHEATEWFRVNGANLIDPHPELKEKH